MLLIENRSLHHTVGCNDGCVYLDLCGEAERMTAILFLTVFKGTAGLGQVVVNILANCGIIGDDANQVSEVFYCI